MIKNLLAESSNYNRILNNLPNANPIEAEKRSVSFKKAQEELNEKFKYSLPWYHKKRAEPVYIGSGTIYHD